MPRTTVEVQYVPTSLVSPYLTTYLGTSLILPNPNCSLSQRDFEYLYSMSVSLVSYTIREIMKSDEEFGEIAYGR